jgi:glycosyltransferase involved in cell wall biosynthesis
MFDYMAGGKPVIINLKGEASELIAEADCGLLAKEEDAADMAKKILQLAENPTLAKRLGASGKTFVEKNYQRERIAEKLEKYLAAR